MSPPNSSGVDDRTSRPQPATVDTHVLVPPTSTTTTGPPDGAAAGRRPSSSAPATHATGCNTKSAMPGGDVSPPAMAR